MSTRTSAARSRNRFSQSRPRLPFGDPSSAGGIFLCGYGPHNDVMKRIEAALGPESP